MYKIFRSLLFLLSTENAHALVMFFLKISGKIFGIPQLTKKIFSIQDKRLEKNVFGIDFKNPVGFAAGFDKNAEVCNYLGNWGFAFVETGTITPKAQSGNPKPRSFRLKKDGALINRMGFNNDGVEKIVERLKKRKKNHTVIGGNIGKNTTVANSDAVGDYLTVFKTIYDFVDYIAVNVSCPNITNLQKLQNRAELEILLRALIEERNKRQTYRPILVKISPDLSFAQIDDTVELIEMLGIDGIIATNTTISRESLATPLSEIEKIGAGGLSGKPLTNRALAAVRHISQKTAGKLPIIAVGGITTVEDAINMIEAGASLIQIYTGYIYQGPYFVKKILKALLQRNGTSC
ncbi:MAG: quinone-dependent dihydroorotate dehydrogenase [Prevotellaceae bacterium]|jgi:dihydroorotate dehydrogenase|nr:quinone-dependent dihydroorotate dehydrogenase [Prevotellaceae bacterium]